MAITALVAHTSPTSNTKSTPRAAYTGGGTNARPPILHTQLQSPAGNIYTCCLELSSQKANGLHNLNHPRTASCRPGNSVAGSNEALSQSWVLPPPPAKSAVSTLPLSGAYRDPENGHSHPAVLPKTKLSCQCRLNTQECTLRLRLLPLQDRKRVREYTGAGAVHKLLHNHQVAAPATALLAASTPSHKAGSPAKALPPPPLPGAHNGP